MKQHNSKSFKNLKNFIERGEKFLLFFFVQFSRKVDTKHCNPIAYNDGCLMKCRPRYSLFQRSNVDGGISFKHVLPVSLFFVFVGGRKKLKLLKWI